MRLRAIRRAFCTTERKLWPRWSPPVVPGSEDVLGELQVDLVEKEVAKGNFAVAIDGCKRIMDICAATNQPAPESGMRCILARIYEYIGNHNKAATEWTHAITSKADLGPSAPIVKAARIMCLLRSNQIDEAAGAVKSAVESYPNDDRFKVLQAVVAYQHVNLSDAVSLLQKVPNSSEIYGQAMLLYGTCLFGMEDEDRATKVLSRASQWFEGREKEWGMVAAGLQQRDPEETQKAVKLVEPFINHPLLGEALRGLACQLMTDDPVAAEGLFRTAVTHSSSPNFYIPNYYTQSVYASVISDFSYLLCHMEFNGQSRVRNAFKLLQSPVQFGGQSYSLRSYMQEPDIVKAAEQETQGLFEKLREQEQQFRPGLFWWMEELSRPHFLNKGN